MSIEAINPVSLSKMQNIESLGATRPETGNSAFANLLTGGISTLNENITASEAALAGYILNGEISTHDLMITLEKAKHSMQIAVEVRNKVVEAYQEITRMQV